MCWGSLSFHYCEGVDSNLLNCSLIISFILTFPSVIHTQMIQYKWFKSLNLETLTLLDCFSTTYLLSNCWWYSAGLDMVSGPSGIVTISGNFTTQSPAERVYMLITSVAEWCWVTGCSGVRVWWHQPLPGKLPRRKQHWSTGGVLIWTLWEGWEPVINLLQLAAFINQTIIVFWCSGDNIGSMSIATTTALSWS